MKELFFTKQNYRAMPSDDESIKIYKNFPVGAIFRAGHWKDRNYLFHKKLFRLVKLVTDNNPKFPNPYHLIKALQLDIGSVDIVKKLSGEVLQYPKSLKFKTMGAVEFAELYKDIRTVMEANLHILLPGLPVNEFRGIANEIFNMY